MSVIRAQAFRFSIINYLATGLAAISTLWIYPLELDAYGLAQFLVSMAYLCIPIATLGTLTVVVKFFPEYDALGKRKSYLFNTLALGFACLAVAGLVAVLINEPVLKFLEFLGFDAYLVARHKFTVAVLIGIIFYNGTLIMHASNYNKIAIPSAYQNLLPKFFLPILILALYTHMIDMAEFARFWVLSFAISSIGLTIYLNRIGGLDMKPEFNFFRKGRLKKLLSYSSYVGAGAMGHLLVGKIDVIMVGTLIGLKETGLYGMALFIGNVLSIPTNAILQITSPVLAKALEEGNWDRVTEVYKKSATNLLIAGIFIYFLILGTLDAILHLSPRYDEMGWIVPLFAIIGISKLIDMAASVNHQILTFSTEYRSVLIFVLIMGVSNVVLNYLLITFMSSAMGAAIATCLSVYIYQVLKYRYIEQKFGIHPFTGLTFRILMIFIILFVYYLLLPQVASPFIQAIIYCAGLMVIYFFCIRLFRIQSDITEAAYRYMEAGWSRLRR